MRVRQRSSESAEIERRDHQRFVGDDVTLRSLRLRAKALDLSQGGLGIETLQQPLIGSEYGFQVHHRKTVAEIEARVRWCVLKRTIRTPAGDVLPVFQAGLDLIEKPFAWGRLLSTLAVQGA